MTRALLVFIDGIGFGRPGAQNPFDGAPVRTLAPLADVTRAGASGVVYGELDATLGHPGLPQSATGQAAIFTGDNAAQIHNGHREGYPTRAIAQLILERSVLARARHAGHTAAFLNGYDRERIELIAQMCAEVQAKPSSTDGVPDTPGPPDGASPRPRRPRRKPSASSLAAMAGGGSLRTFEDVERGAAATFDLSGETCRAYGIDAPRRTVREAARAIATGAAEVDLSLFELFLTDKAGHSQDISWARYEIARTERFLEELFAAVDRKEQLVVIVSDHGNLEDLSTRSHTRANVPLLAYGAGASAFVEGAKSLLDVAPRLLDALGGRGGDSLGGKHLLP